MLTQQEAEDLLSEAKEAARREILSWGINARHDEVIVAVVRENVEFVLSLARNPFEIKAHFRTKAGNVHLARIDTQIQHLNPDGTQVRGPHLHWYREGYSNLEWAEPIDWYDANRPLLTLTRFLDLIHARFPYGIQEAML